MIKKVLNKVYFIFGLLSLLLGLIGLALPVMPTMPFLIVSIFLFDKSSPKFHAWCMKIPGVEKAYNDWTKHRVIKKESKIKSVGLMMCSAVFITFSKDLPMYLKVIVISILFVVSVLIITRKSSVDINSEAEGSIGDQ